MITKVKQPIARFFDKTNAPRLIALMGASLVALWVALWVVVAFTSVVSTERILPLMLGYDNGSPYVPSLGYSLIHFSFSHLVYDLIWFCGLLNVCRKRLSAGGFVQVASLGAIGGGLTWFYLFRHFSEPGGVVGARLLILSLLGALAVLETDRVSVFGDSIRLKFVLVLAWLFLIALPVYLGIPPKSDAAAWLLSGTLLDGVVLILAMFRVRIIRIAVIWLLTDVIVWLVWSFRPDVFLSDVAGLGIGIAYVSAVDWGSFFEN